MKKGDLGKRAGPFHLADFHPTFIWQTAFCPVVDTRLYIKLLQKLKLSQVSRPDLSPYK